MRCASASERQVSEQVGEWAISMMADPCFDGERQFAPTAAVVAFSSRRGGRRCRRIAAVRGRCRRGIASLPSDKPYCTLDKANSKHFGPDPPTKNMSVFWSSLRTRRRWRNHDEDVLPSKTNLLQITSNSRCACAKLIVLFLPPAGGQCR